MVDVIDFSKSLIACPSVTPINAGAIPLLCGALETIGFECHQMTFEEAGTEKVDNLFASIGSGERHISFAGHTDVVPPGDLSRWRFDPFEPTIYNDMLYGRGASDMKTAIAAFTSACYRFTTEHPSFDGKISFLITNDEEGAGINGTCKLVKWLQKNHLQPTHCIVGEPTSESQIGDVVKIGRRGSVNYTLQVKGTQGHVAYPHKAANPVPVLIELLHQMSHYLFDEGCEFFQPTNLEITSVDVGNNVTNLIAESASAMINVRFSASFLSHEISDILTHICKKTVQSPFLYELDHRVSGESFLTKPDALVKLVEQSIFDITQKKPILSTGGGTSDARFIKDLCPVIELGVRNQTAHQIDEHVAINDIITLRDIYLRILERYFFCT